MDTIDNEHIKPVDTINAIHTLLGNPTIDDVGAHKTEH
jgi:hypothetical protein